jgi:hypothetical protein
MGEFSHELKDAQGATPSISNSSKAAVQQFYNLRQNGNQIRRRMPLH